ncbi:hybrid sensor histidine kinase/response regulator [Vibrio sp. vnigr-6D03]|uniref:PAS domain S-box protein n=1 Tax=Vibrio sp. vnigr-6D03 TaxID=2058088 RepID=UPI000C32C5A2|nr:PAS domain S-box protein [Vibrio sp. vnigr-6D03]PKF77187.1 hybrid sensor histidine kinase/response regulator [Vibrio sp. vnigr-6D03]
MKIKVKNITLLIAVTTLLFSVLYYVTWNATHELENKVQDEMQDVAKELIEKIDRNLFERFHDARAFALNARLSSSFSNENSSPNKNLEEYLDKLITEYKVYSHILVFTTQGDLVAQNRMDVFGEKIKPIESKSEKVLLKQWFNNVLNESYLKPLSPNPAFPELGTVVYGPHSSLFGQQSVRDEQFDMMFATAIKNDIGEVTGVWVNVLDFKFLEEIFLEYHLSLLMKGYNNVQLLLVDQKDDVLIDMRSKDNQSMDYFRENSELKGQNIDDHYRTQSTIYRDSTSGISLVSQKGGDELLRLRASSLGAYDFPGLSWQVYIQVPPESAFVEAAQLKTKLWLISIMIIAVLAATGLYMFYRVSSPLKQLANIFSQLSRNDFSTPLPKYRRSDEVGEIIKAVDIFKSRLQEREKLLKKTLDQQQELDLQRRAIRAAKSGMMVCDAEDHDLPIVYVNHAFLAMTGYTSEEVIGRNPRFLHGPDPEHPGLIELRSALSEGRSCNVYIQNQRKDESIFQCHLHVDPVYSDEGELTHFIGVQTDVTELHQAKEEAQEANRMLQDLIAQTTLELEDSESRMKAVFKSAIDSLIIFKLDETILDINDSARKLFGWTREELLGKPFETLLADNFEQKGINFLTHSISVDSPDRANESDEVIGQTKEGKLVPLEMSITQVAVNGEAYYLGTLRDISDRKHAESELKLSKISLQDLVRRLNLATEAGEIGIWNWDFRSGELEWDDRMFLMYDVDRENATDTYDMWKTRVLEEDASRAEEELMKAKDTLSRFSSEFRIQWKNGDIRWIKAAADVVFDESSGEAIGMGGVNIDITKEKTAQDLLRRESELATAANEAKSMFLANMSHEIRTPMNGVVGMINLLSETELAPEQSTMATTIRDSSMTLLNIINDILDFSKIEAGQMQVENIPVEFHVVMERTADVLFLQAQKKNISLLLKHDSRIPQYIMSDGVRLGQVLLNVVGNAVKFTSGDEHYQGQVWIMSELISNDGQDEIEIRVQDNGIGMSQSQMDKLFSAFTQADTSTTRVYGGTGLGLSITKSLIEMMGGRIRVESQVGEGSCFIMTIPCVYDLNFRMEQDDIPYSETRILSVLRSPELSEVVKYNLESVGCEVVSVSSFAKAEMVLTHEEKGFNIMIAGPEYSSKDIDKVYEGNIGKLLDGKAKTLLLSEDSSSSKGFVASNTMVSGAHPLKPSELEMGVAILMGKRSPIVENKQKLRATKDLPTKEQAEKEGRLILVAEDQPTNRDVIERQLNRLGYVCDMAEDGLAGLNMWNKGRYGLVLTDCHMPIMDGFELTKEIRKIELEQHVDQRTPVIAITANALVGSAEHCIQAGMDDYLSKPVELNTLGKILDKWLDASAESSSENDEIEHTDHNLNVDAPFKHDLQIPELEESNAINFERLEAILGTAELDVLAPLLQGYWDSLQEDMNALESALTNKDESQIQSIAHAAKGAANSAGAERLAESFLTLQNEALKQDWGYLENVYQQSVTKVTDIQKYLEKEKII